ncbi:TPA: YfhL family 4Fe-4S dicluster ferredoxin [Campylobacter lari]|nr:YfhL family 4Fe-4S dicluster ferredoxin [Campylobacter lari]HEC1782953.1 YfhL family 4Fe-4S dicluster ferredoxin [Campylobacter lari]
MSLLITRECISCDACREECPDEAIYDNDPIYVIDPDLCTECVNEFSEPACIVACPVDCIIPDPDNAESIDELRLKHKNKDI